MSKLSSEQFANSGPSPTTEDAFKTVSHLADAVGHDLKHGSSHLFSLMKHIQKDPMPDKTRETLLFHANHSMKHTLGAKEHSEKLGKHVARHPAFRSATQEIRQIDPMRYGGV